MAENKVRFGLSNVHIAMMTDEGTYDAPIPIPGAVSLTTDPEGASEKFYADNGTYYNIVTNDGYTGELNVALLPDDVKIKVFNWVRDDNRAIVEVADALPSPFALLFKVNGDAKERMNVFYHCLAERPKNEDKTTEDKATPTTETLPLTMTPEDIGGKRVTKLSIEPSEANAEACSKFFESVLLPSFAAAPVA